jgi:hypothetical protein
MFGAQFLMLTQLGFRGAPLGMLLATVIALLVVLPSDHPWMRPRQAIAVVAALCLASAFGFWAAAAVRSEAASESGLSSTGTQFRSDTWARAIGDRLNLEAPASMGVSVANSRAAQDAVAWSTYSQSIIPRAIYPDKPVMDYGQRVTRDIYLKDYKSSSSVTVIGDIYINARSMGIFICAAALALALAALERRFRVLQGRSTYWPPLVIITTQCLTQLEGSPILLLVGAARNALLLVPLWVLATKFARREQGGAMWGRSTASVTDREDATSTRVSDSARSGPHSGVRGPRPQAG